ncbi:cyclase family protein [Lentzea nigeriaca]|uniref:cyclase family protein n=1 Tax=Lentzea nigeriaca TaxID=1128665 RepID=UPI001956A8E3|nr:cyclase family protein [Lentzea nigeriaca]MBM7858601.1 kynurenine formamidase [Lentzea nigeriaca]
MDRTTTIVDLSMPVADLPFDPGVVKIEPWTHADGPRRIGRKAAFSRHVPLATRLGRAIGYLTGRRRIDERSFPDGLFLGNEFLTLSVHAGTHVDAPFHYGPTCEGKAAKKIHEIPLDWCVGPGVLIGLTDKKPGESITVEDLTAELDRIGHELQPGEIVLLHTGSDHLWPTPAYFGGHPGMTVPALDFLLDHGIRVIGTDTAGFDLPAPVMIERYYRTGDRTHLWPCHLFGRTREYLQIERMGHFDRLPAPTGFTVCCLPINVRGAGAGWARPVALVPAEIDTAAIDNGATSSEVVRG